MAIDTTTSNTGSIYTQNIQAKDNVANVNLYTGLVTNGSLTIGSAASTCTINSSTTFNNYAPSCSVVATATNQLVTKSYVDSKTYQVLNFSPSEVTNIKKSIIYRYGNNITSSSITAKLDNAPTIPQVYTFGKKINNLWLGGSSGDTQIYYSINGTSWQATAYTNTSNPFISSGVVNGLAWNGSRWIAVGQCNMGSTSIQINYSDDGINWNRPQSYTSTFSTNGIGYGVAWNGKNRWVAVGSIPNGSIAPYTTIVYSTTGSSWSHIGYNNDPFGNSNGAGYGVAYNGTMWVAVGKGKNTIAYSSDGITWGATNFTKFNEAHGVAWNGQMWVAVGKGAGDELCYSFDGINWSGRGEKFNGTGYGVAWNGKIWVAVGTGSNSIIYSYNGLDWSVANSPMFSGSSYYAKGILWSGSMWVAVGLTTGTLSNIAYSIDGIIWTSGTGVTTVVDTLTSAGFNSARPNTITFDSETGSITMTNSNISLSTGDQLDVICDLYYNTGFTNCSISIDN